MSQEIDQRVVEMRFDNAQFEKNSRDTMRTLDKLKEKLSFKGAAKGLEQVQAASENVDFSGMEKGLDTVQAKFSALDVIAFTALQRITDKVISTGEQMVKNLSVDQITSGWDKYNEKTSNVQTIMNATGKSIDQVNGYLNKLMWYSDETSYSFNEMTSALSQMTAAGGKIDKMIPMIMGIGKCHSGCWQDGFCVPEHHPKPDPELQRRAFAATGLEEPEPDGYGDESPETGAYRHCGGAGRHQRRRSDHRQF